jgi:hypothetical protein
LTTVLPLSPFQVLMLAAVVGLLWPVPSEAKA